MELETLQKDLDAELRLLAYKQENGKGIVDKANATTIGRHRDALVCLAKEAQEIKLKFEEKKIAKGEQMDEVCAWSNEIDKVIEGVDPEIEYLGKCLREANKSWRDINSEGEESDGASESKRKNDRNDWNARVPPPRGRSYQVQQQASERQMRGWVYCDDTNDTSANYTKVLVVGDCKRILSQKQLCFNCTSDKHRADSCRSRGCHNCQRRHHTSICDHPPSGHTTRGRFMTAQNKGTGRVVYPVVVGEVNEIKCRALLDTGVGSSYESSAILEHLGNKPLREEFKRLEMMLRSTNKVIGVHSVTIGSLDGKFRLETEVTRVDRSTLLSLDNPGYAEILEKYPYLGGVYMADRDEKPELPVHIILGASEYAKIKTETIPKIGRAGEPVAELTKFGWTIMSPGKEVDLSNMFLTQTTAANYEQLCKLDVLGLCDTPSGDQADVYEEFKEQLTRGPEGCTNTGKRQGCREIALDHRLAIQASEILRFTRALFGLAPSPFLLGGVIKQHLEACRTENPDLVREIEKTLYVDDLISGGPTVKAAREVKAGVTHVFNQASFKLHKWHSNVPAVESPGESLSEDTTFAKEQLGAPQEGGGSILGLPWNKRQDTIEINFPTDRTQVTKRGILAKIARVYHPLGLAAPMTLSGKLLYRDACDLKVGWDAQLPGQLGTKWSRWEAQLPVSISVPRAIPQHFEEISNIELHCFGEESRRGVSAAVYGVISQPSGDSVGLMAAKARLAKQDLAIPRLELVSGHMATNLIVNVKVALEGFPVGNMFCWLDSSVALHWIKGAGSYKQFVSNRGQKIQQHPEVNWRHVGTKDNPDKLGSRSGSVENEELWWRGLEWLLDRERWPADIKTTATPDSQAEAKVIREVFAVAQAKTDILDALLVNVGEVVLIKSDDKNRGKWKVGIVTELIKGRDGVVRGAKLRTGTSHLERAVQQLYPLELSCDRPGDGDRPPTTELRIEAPAFRPSRDAAVAARLRMEDLAHDEEGD
ncbi:hypothetical protein AWC38_SpisGene6275 [Stylophora pistillata]|uniref:DUF5641 domain-containing protein n=1 Tax=Stylophora pistillata TaxID=50429 RepID=A0A2B4SGF1_STYPI|nr:hypothetical protein AWC38_SpisGene6275 [Stylophora pistillata]